MSRRRRRRLKGEIEGGGGRKGGDRNATMPPIVYFETFPPEFTVFLGGEPSKIPGPGPAISWPI